LHLPQIVAVLAMVVHVMQSCVTRDITNKATENSRLRPMLKSTTVKLLERRNLRAALRKSSHHYALFSSTAKLRYYYD